MMVAGCKVSGVVVDEAGRGRSQARKLSPTSQVRPNGSEYPLISNGP